MINKEKLERDIFELVSNAVAMDDRHVSVYVDPEGGVSISIYPFKEEETNETGV